MKSINCPCESGFDYESCCKPYHTNLSNPLTPVALMRSRYSAYVLQLIDYLLDTTHIANRYLHDRDAIGIWAKRNLWLGLEILEAEANTVQFKAFYKCDNKISIHHEVSTFKIENGRWYYYSGVYFD